jgi:hypothetical protein
MTRKFCWPELVKSAFIRDRNIPPTTAAEAEVNVLEVAVEAGCGPGDGFACEILAVTAKIELLGKVEQVSYIAKVIPDTEQGEVIRKVINNFTTRHSARAQWVK